MGTITVHGIEIAYEVWGDGPETVVTLHNAILCRQGMEPFAERIADRYRVVLWDFRGMGESAMLDVPSIGVETLYEDAVSVIRQSSDRPVHLVGMALGGAVGLRVAARQPQLLKSLTVMGTGPEGAESHPQGGAFVDLLAEKGYADPAIVEIAMKLSFAPSVRDDPARAEEMARWAAMMRDTDPRTLAIARNLQTRLSIENEIGHIEAPTLIVACDEDANHPLAEAEGLAAAIPGSRVERLAGAGHTPTVERPDEFAALVASFLAEVDAKAGVSSRR